MRKNFSWIRAKIPNFPIARINLFINSNFHNQKIFIIFFFQRRKNRRSVRISMMDEHDHSHNPKFAIEEEKNNSTKLINTSDSTEETSSKQLLQNGPHKM